MAREDDGAHLAVLPLSEPCHLFYLGLSGFESGEHVYECSFLMRCVSNRVRKIDRQEEKREDIEIYDGKAPTAGGRLIYSRAAGLARHRDYTNPNRRFTAQRWDQRLKGRPTL